MTGANKSVSSTSTQRPKAECHTCLFYSHLYYICSSVCTGKTSVMQNLQVNLKQNVTYTYVSLNLSTNNALQQPAQMFTIIQIIHQIILHGGIILFCILVPCDNDNILPKSVWRAGCPLNSNRIASYFLNQHFNYTSLLACLWGSARLLL